MKMPEMPELPDPIQLAVSVRPHERREYLAYSAEQVRAYAMAYGQAVREECAKACEEVDRTTGECPEMARYCAAAIRAKE